ncbi:MAG: Gfo/Idh/MocA family oxidoreductase [Aeromicrobium sp.]
MGIVGLSATGGWAGRSHVPAIRAVEGFELRALSASSVESAARAGEVHGVSRTFGSARELAECDQVDLVVIAVKVPHHLELVTAALDAGKAVYCEWPLGNGLAEAQRLDELATARGVPAVVGLQARFSPEVRYLRDLVADGYVGEVLSTTVTGRGMSWGSEIANDAQRYLLDAANGATMLTIPVGHALDAVFHVLGKPVEETIVSTLATRRGEVLVVETGDTARMTAVDQVAFSGELISGAVISCHYRGGGGRGEVVHWEINGTDGDLLLTLPAGQLQMSPSTLRGARGQDRELRPLTVPDGYHLVPALRGEAEGPAYNVAQGYQLWLDGWGHMPDFAHAVRHHRTLGVISPGPA